MPPASPRFPPGDASADTASRQGPYSPSRMPAGRAHRHAAREAVDELQRLFALADGYGFREWLLFDPSVVRGLAYYTGTVFEGFDRGKKLRAICGGGRYDKLLGAFGGEEAPMAGFGFGDAVIVELLKDLGKLPAPPHKVDDVVVPLDASLRPAAAGVATQLRRAGRLVDLVLEAKKMKWAFKPTPT
ncbi:Histidine--tRNA ligase [Tetrabaena socialis]|uniref:histidine--tRNA ligase n=1 Tax=Tetrabaena socialis TaxID=47790 RepID=A0A2J8A1S5_9CHLO|nr:Histidine--tRNA ligase [Tetrabaena socialis]|eukprot:PNH06479.1 Histidine--tRNA ligase [Tetrabaena socialis]